MRNALDVYVFEWQIRNTLRDHSLKRKIQYLIVSPRKSINLGKMLQKIKGKKKPSRFLISMKYISLALQWNLTSYRFSRQRNSWLIPMTTFRYVPKLSPSPQQVLYSQYSTLTWSSIYYNIYIKMIICHSSFPCVKI